MKETLIYIYPEYSTFIAKDISLLSARYNVITPRHSWREKILTPLNFLRQFFFLLINIHSSRAVFVMFGGYWSFLPALFGRVVRKPVYIIPGGTDCVSFPSLKYGSLRKPFLRIFIKWSFRMCTKLIPVDESLIWCDYNYYVNSEYRNQGYSFFFPGLKTPSQVIHNGFDPSFFSCAGSRRLHNSFITIAPVSNMMRFRVKGIDNVLWLAKNYSDCTFTVIGISESVISQIENVPGNVSLMPFLPQEKFRDYLAKSEFILQLSVSEGFPNSLCEAMLCGCIPVGSSVGAMPSIIADTGYLMKSSDKDHLKERFKEILKTDDQARKQMSERARARIIENYHISFRGKALFDLLESVE